MTRWTPKPGVKYIIRRSTVTDYYGTEYDCVVVEAVEEARPGLHASQTVDIRDFTQSRVDPLLLVLAELDRMLEEAKRNAYS